MRESESPKKKREKINHNCNKKKIHIMAFILWLIWYSNIFLLFRKEKKIIIYRFKKKFFLVNLIYCVVATIFYIMKELLLSIIT